MAAFLIRRAAFAVVTLFAVLTLVFVVVRILPGDPAQLILGDQPRARRSRRFAQGSGSISPSSCNI
jgi:ABC-type dipeptide/oligopeptide/nickel transport system permease component